MCNAAYREYLEAVEGNFGGTWDEWCDDELEAEVPHTMLDAFDYADEVEARGEELKEQRSLFDG